MKSKSKIIFLLIAVLTFTNLTGCAKIVDKIDKASPNVTKELTGEEYVDEIITNLNSITASFQGITELIKSDPKFDAKLNDYLKDIKRAAENYLKMDNVPPTQYSEVHKYTTRAMEDYKSAVDAYPKDRATLKTADTEDAMDFMQSASDNIMKAMDEVKKLD